MSKSNNLIDMLNSLTTIKTDNLKKLTDVSTSAIADIVYINRKDDVNEVCIDVGIGSLLIWWDEEDIKYRFHPSMTLNHKVRDAINGTDTLQTDIEDKINVKMLRTFKELM